MKFIRSNISLEPEKLIINRKAGYRFGLLDVLFGKYERNQAPMKLLAISLYNQVQSGIAKVVGLKAGKQDCFSKKTD